MFAYGQTGSGKTFTIQGIQQRLANDLFERQTGHLLDEQGKSRLQIFASFIQLIGNEASDLLNDNQTVMVGENKFGKVEIQGAREIEINHPNLFLEINSLAARNRTTSSTFKNDTSSRSHAICKIRFKNTHLLSMEDGELFIIDLAGSESTADMQFHDKDLVKQTQQINKSLMALKDCIRNRALSAVNEDMNIHIPYRNSKLTLLLKESFELMSNKHSKTVIIANVGPSVSDLAMTKNTLRFVTPIKVGSKQRANTKHLEPSKENPATWTNEMLSEWVIEVSNGRIEPKQFCPFETGKQILTIRESEFIARAMLCNTKLTEKQGKYMYDKIWKLLIDARTKQKYSLKKGGIENAKKKKQELAEIH